MKAALKTSWQVLAAVALGNMLAGCAQLPREPLVHQPMTIRADPQVRTAAPQPERLNGAIYPTGFSTQAFFEDRRARYVGDILTILVSENVNASKNSAANVSRSGSASASLALLPAALGGLGAGTALDSSGSGKNSLTAKGGANAANTFNGVITVTIVEVLPNGNLMVSGEKQLLINQGTEFIRFSGVVNPRVVGGNNTVASNQVADAKIEYSAKGYIDEAQTMGWLQRFFLNVMPF